MGWFNGFKTETPKPEVEKPVPEKVEEEGYVDCYEPEERHIYSYFDGTKVRKVDPMLLYKAKRRKWTDITIAWKLAGSISSQAMKGQENLILLIRQVFDVKPLDEGGLTEVECVELLTHFVKYCDELQKKTPLFPMLSSYQWSPPNSSSDQEGSPTVDSSVSGSARLPSCSCMR